MIYAKQCSKGINPFEWEAKPPELLDSKRAALQAESHSTISGQKFNFEEDNIAHRYGFREESSREQSPLSAAPPKRVSDMKWPSRRIAGLQTGTRVPETVIMVNNCGKLPPNALRCVTNSWKSIADYCAPSWPRCSVIAVTDTTIIASMVSSREDLGGRLLVEHSIAETKRWLTTT